MQADPVRVEDTRAWLEKSSKDLRRAELSLAVEPPDTEDALFHLQQAIEKALKAYLVWRDRAFRKTHDLLELANLCVEIDEDLAGPLDGLAALTRYAWEFRYPGESAEPSIEEAQAWLFRARQVVGAVLDRLPAEGKP